MDNSEEKKKPVVRTPKASTPQNQKLIQDKGKITAEQVTTLKALLTPEREPKLLSYYKIEKLEDLPAIKFAEALNNLQKKEKGENNNE